MRLVVFFFFQVVESPRSPPSCATSLCFSDGRRKVDYVLVFHQRRHSSIRSPASLSASHEMLSVVSNGNFPSVGSDVEAAKGGGTQRGEAPLAGEVLVEVRGAEPAEPALHEMRMIREEFEANLLEAGLEIERDSEVGGLLCSPLSFQTQPSDLVLSVPLLLLGGSISTCTILVVIAMVNVS